MLSKIKEIYLKINKKQLSDQLANILLKSLCSFKNLSLQLHNYPQKVLTDLFNSKIDNNLFYPIQTVQLRHLLNSNQINSNVNIIFYPFQFSKKYFNDYSMLVSINKLEETKQVQGFYYTENNNLKIELNKIFIFEKESSKNIYRIFKQKEFNNYGFIKFIPNVNPVIANNFYKKIKIADGQMDLGNDSARQEWNPEVSNNYGDVQQQYAIPNLSVGDAVVLKTQGITQQKPLGRVQKILDNIAYITWNKPIKALTKGKIIKTNKTTLDLLDPFKLSNSIIKL